MEENKDYQVYRFDYLTEGSQLKLDHSVYCEDVDISSLITQSADALEALRQDSIDGEQKALAIVQAAAKPILLPPTARVRQFFPIFPYMIRIIKRSLIPFPRKTYPLNMLLPRTRQRP